MPNERIVYTHDQGPDKGFRILATGEFDADMVEVLKAFAKFQAKVVPKKSAAKKAEDATPENVTTA